METSRKDLRSVSPMEARKNSQLLKSDSGNLRRSLLIRKSSKLSKMWEALKNRLLTRMKK